MTALRKYSKDVVIDLVFEDADEDWAYSIEEILRPLPEIGWNTLAGGNRGLSGEVLSTKIKDAYKNPESKYNTDEYKITRSEATSKAWRERIGGMRSDEHLDKISKTSLLWWNDKEYRAKMKVCQKPSPKWKNGTANKEIWVTADFFWCLWKGHSHYPSKIERELGMKKGQLVKMFKQFDEGWNPFEDDDWKEFKANYHKEE